MPQQKQHANNSSDGHHMRKLGTYLQNTNPGLCFVLLIAPFKEHGMANYISNGTREDIIKFMRETADSLEKNKDFQIPNNN